MWWWTLLGCVWIGPDEVAAFEDRDGDGLPNGVDCDNADPSVGSAPTWYRDRDEDGWGDPASLVQACELPKAASSLAGDCDDTDAVVNPWASESCAPRDEDCDGLAGDLDPQGAVDATEWFTDEDGDGYGAGASVRACVAPLGRVSAPGDCDDGDDATFPGAPESCGGIDRDCDAHVDDADEDVTGQATWRRDADGDGYGDPGTEALACARPPGHTEDRRDCDDTDAATSPAGVERCGGGDEDCDGLTDDADPQVLGQGVWFDDGDRDGFGDFATRAVSCDAAGRVADGTDCDDDDVDVNPGRQEVCDALDVDEDCDGAVDDADGDVTGTARYYVDSDGDGFGSPDAPERWCDPPGDVTPEAGDCDDLRDDVFPGAIEVWYDGVDGACDQGDDFDADRDGFRWDGALGDDCDDTQPLVHPGADELWYDDIDQDCAGDDDFDADHDGFIADAHGGDDCDDDDPDIHPLADELWYDGVDQDCAGDDDFDADHDGYRAVGFPDGDDCDDAEPATHPYAEEFMDAVDSDCDAKDFVCGDVTRRVPRDYAQPQPAFDAACAGDVVRIDPGDYVGPFVVNRNLTVEGAGPGVRLVGNGVDRVVRASRSTWRDLEITGGVADGYPGGAGIYVNAGTGARFERLVFRGNRADSRGAGLGVEASANVVIEDVVFVDNAGLGLFATGVPDLTVKGSTFTRNGGGGAAISSADRVSLADLTFVDNQIPSATTWSGAALNLSTFTDAVITRLTLDGNVGGQHGGLSVVTGDGLRLSDVVIRDSQGASCAALCVSGVTDAEVSDFLIERAAVGIALSVRSEGTWVHDGAIRDGVGPATAIDTSAPGIVFERVTLENHQGWGFSIGDPATLRDVEIRGNRGIDIWTTAPVTLERVRSIYSLSSGNPALVLVSPTIRGVEVLGSGASIAGSVDIEGLLIADSGLYVSPAGATGRVSHLTVVGAPQRAVFASTPAVPSLDHVLLAYNYDGLRADPPFPISHCALYGNEHAEDTFGNHDLTGCVRDDPRFVSYGPGLAPTAMDLHLRAGSPLRDAGAPGDDRDASPGDLGAYGGPSDALGGLAYDDDFDADGLPDGWEDRHGLDATTPDADDDLDRDGLTNRAEWLRGTNPASADTDDDGREDLDEIDLGLDPLSPYDG